jgi:cytochrome d ubiquinol oxidase subunit II
MVEGWFAIIATMLTLYVVLDGFDLGAGLLHLIVAKRDAERRQVLAAIGPYWDGNEVWLVASAGALLVAFPRVMAVGLSGFYFAIFLLLWSLVLRGISIEFRGHVGDPLWRRFWDAVWCLASALLALFFGVALGNLIRGLPLHEDGWFGLELFTDWSARSPVGILDWYTVLVGAFALATLALHGAHYLWWRTEGAVSERSRAAARRLAVVVLVAWPIVTVATVAVNPSWFAGFAHRPVAWLGFAAALAGTAAVALGLARRRALLAFAGSSGLIAGLLSATAACMFPVMLKAVPDDARSLTAYAASNDPAGLRAALGWWWIGFPVAIGYLIVLFRLHREKIVPMEDGEGY